MSFIPAVCIDFDGVIHAHTAWNPELHQPHPNGVDLLLRLKPARDAKLMRAVVLTAREDLDAVRAWLIEHKLADLVDQVTNRKVPALAYIDDRALNGTAPAWFILDRLADLTRKQIPQAVQYVGGGVEEQMRELAHKLEAGGLSC